ncbi:MAG TPA: hypothetical protein VMF89_09175, partial [Polyangiales bacterium]|nr:hypothetical protein [Polyangiales bacterium]
MAGAETGGGASGGGTATGGAIATTGGAGSVIGGEGSDAAGGFTGTPPTAGAPGMPEGGAPSEMQCPEGQHLCATGCVRNDDARTCGTSCTPCEAPSDGSATCDGTRCGAKCEADHKLCAGRCIEEEE